MKVNIGPYKNWFGPYQLAEKLCFWAKPVKDEYGFDRTPDWVHNFGEWLAHGDIEPEQEVGEIRAWDRERKNTWLYKFLIWVDSKKKRKIKVHIDRWDTWSMDRTLAEIALPMLKQLRATAHGYQLVDFEDLPTSLQMTDPRDLYDGQYDLFELEVCNPENISIGEAQWDWVLGEMIFAFEHILDDIWEEKFRNGEYDLRWKKLDNGMLEMVYGENHTVKHDDEGLKAVHDRIRNGFRLFGKYYQGLWD